MNRLHAGLAVGAAALAIMAAVVDRTAAGQIGHVATIGAPDLATRIMRRDERLRVVDLRSRQAFDEFHVPTAVHATLNQLPHLSLPPAPTVVLYAEAMGTVNQAAALLQRRGIGEVRVLREGIHEWIGRVLEPRLAPDATAEEEAAFARAETLSRYFGGSPQRAADRSEVPVGYWTGVPRQAAALADVARASVAAVRRRGC